jgi:serine/threonine protein phosphatase PrpC
MIPVERSHIHVAAITHPGMSGKNNEDNYAVTAHQLSQTDTTPSVLAVLADGVGGHHAGEVAAEIATETISKLVLDSDAANPLEILNQAFVQANQKVADQSEAKDERQGMGSTCACVWIINDSVFTASVGDSRIYFIRDGIIRQVTTDHTWVQEAIEHGIITPEQARNHPRAHVIRRYLGSRKPVEPDFRLRLHQDETDEQAVANQGMKLIPGDQFLICSDGLTDLVADSEILEILQNNKMDRALQSLVDLANERGGHDNITILVLKVPDPEEVEKRKDKTKKTPRMKLSWQIYLAISIFIIVLVAMSTVLFLYVSRTPSIPTTTPTDTVSETIQPVPEGTLEATQELQPTITPTITFTDTPIPETYTPWPTHTSESEP